MLIQPLVQQTELTVSQAKTVFETLFICVHGLASLLANNSMEYQEEHCIVLLTNMFQNSIISQKENTGHEEAV